MTPQERIERVNKYFVPDPPGPARHYAKLSFGGALLIVALLFFIAGHAAACLGVVAAIGAVVLLYKGLRGLVGYLRAVSLANPKATDAEMDAWLAEADNPIVQAGYQRLNIHPTELGANNRTPYLVFHGIPELFSVLPFSWKRGYDGVMRYSAYEVMVVYLSNWRLPVYECVLDLATGATIRDSTKEYALKQVDGMETVSDRVNVFNSQWRAGSTSAAGGVGGAPGTAPIGMPGPQSQVGHFTQRQIINLLVSGRVAVDLLLGIAPDETTVVQGVTPPSTVDGMISQLREHLRAHSGAALPGNPGFIGGSPAFAAGGIDPGMLNPPPPVAQQAPGSYGQQTWPAIGTDPRLLEPPPPAAPSAPQQN